MSELRTLIEAALNSSNPCATPSLAAGLAEAERRRFRRGGTPSGSYRSSWFLGGETGEQELGTLCLGGEEIQITRFAPDLPGRYARLDMMQSALEADLIMKGLDAGLRFLGRVQAAATSVAALVRVIHPLALDDPDCDVSYSDPVLPYSIFIGVPALDGRHCAARVAEGILHEAMHLQLSLVEKRRPLVKNTDDASFSPWREAQRPVRGILHGLYVFRAIQHFMSDIVKSASMTREERDRCRSRVREIGAEVRQVESLRGHPGLTAAGKLLVQSLLDDALPAQICGACA